MWPKSTRSWSHGLFATLKDALGGRSAVKSGQRLDQVLKAGKGSPLPFLPSASGFYKVTDHEVEMAKGKKIDTAGAGAGAPALQSQAQDVKGDAHENPTSQPAPHIPKVKEKYKGKHHKRTLRALAIAAAAAAAQENSKTIPFTNKHFRPRKTPSAESGGVPEPTQLYITRAHGPSATLSQPRRILVVLDLNGTLLHRPDRRKPFNFVERPHARRFLEYCIDTFHLVIWSSARPDNVEKMVAQLLPEDHGRRAGLVVWARDKFGLSAEDYDSRVQCYKRLTRVWADPTVAATHPDYAKDSKGWDQTNTVLVDDSREKGRSEPYNILAIPEFVGSGAEVNNVLPQVHDYLNLLACQADVSRYVREKEFQLDPKYVLPSAPEQ